MKNIKKYVNFVNENQENFKDWQPKKTQPQTQVQYDDLKDEDVISYDQTIRELKKLEGNKIIEFKTTKFNNKIKFILDSGEELKFFITAEFRNDAAIEDIENYEALLNSKVLEVTYSKDQPAFLKIKTQKGYVVIEFRAAYDYECWLEVL
jgi:hypothetical protein